jgi:GNAT superfamily N-acetyltransferase
MGLQDLNVMCNREFKLIDGLYHPTDTIKVEDRGISLFGNYRSNRYSTENRNDEGYDNSTQIMFDEYGIPNLEMNAMISFLAVRKDLRKNGFGNKMVDVVELIFQERGWGGVDVENVDNPQFWLKRGYSPRTEILEGDLEVEYYTKKFN